MLLRYPLSWMERYLYAAGIARVCLANVLMLDYWQLDLSLSLKVTCSLRLKVHNGLREHNQIT